VKSLSEPRKGQVNLGKDFETSSSYAPWVIFVHPNGCLQNRLTAGSLFKLPLHLFSVNITKIVRFMMPSLNMII